jgi:hypothetical protein
MRGKSGKLEVNDYLFYIAFTAISVLCYLPILWAKFILFKNHCSDAKYSVFFIYKSVLLCIHFTFMQTGYIPFAGKKDTSILGLISLLMILAYLVTSPEPKKDRSQLSRDPLSPISIMLPSPSFRKTYQWRSWIMLKMRPIIQLAVYSGVTAFLILIWRNPLADWLATPATSLSIFSDGAFDTHKAIAYTLYILSALALYSPSLWARFAFSGENFTADKATAALIYNMICSLFHSSFLENRSVLSPGIIDSSALGWLSFFMIIAHADALPYPWKRKFLFGKSS